MKKTPFILVVLVSVLLLTSCSNSSAYDKGYEAGFKSGFDEAAYEYEDDYENGYKDGYSDGCYDSSSSSRDIFGIDGIINSESVALIREEAELYASDAYDWSPEEACDIIICYMEKEKYIDAIPTTEEYFEAVGTLIAFYEYFYNYGL